MLDTHVLLGGRVNDLLGDLDDEAVIARERELHDRLAAMIAGYGQVTAVVVTGATASALVATSRFPADHASTSAIASISGPCATATRRSRSAASCSAG